VLWSDNDRKEPTMTTINNAADAEEPTPERLNYSGMTNAMRNDGTAATDTALPGKSPTGKETVDVADILDPDGTDSDGADVLSQLQPGAAKPKPGPHVGRTEN
jgi:hypothetical protein